MLDSLDRISKICNEELLPTLARMRQIHDEYNSVCMAKECDILGDTLPNKISFTHDDPNDVQVPNLEPKRQKDAATKQYDELPNEYKNTQSHEDQEKVISDGPHELTMIGQQMESSNATCQAVESAYGVADRVLLVGGKVDIDGSDHQLVILLIGANLIHRSTYDLSLYIGTLSIEDQDLVVLTQLQDLKINMEEACILKTPLFLFICLMFYAIF